jgi:hypothetical protein
VPVYEAVAAGNTVSASGFKSSMMAPYALNIP